MFEARLEEGAILKKVIDSVKDLITEANFDCSSLGIALQAMDSSHVSLVTLNMKAEGFQHYRADRTISLGINIGSMSKILKCAGSEDIITLKAEDNGDVVTFMFESPKQTRISHFSLKLMDIDSEHLGIPETEYKCIIKLPSAEFKRICTEISNFGDTVKISASKEGVKFAVTGESGSGGSIILKQNPAVDEEEEAINIKLEDEVNLTFALRYLKSFSAAAPLSKFVNLKMSPDVPLVVEYKLESGGEDSSDIGSLRFYLAPKIDEDEAAAE